MRTAKIFALKIAFSASMDECCQMSCKKKRTEKLSTRYIAPTKALMQIRVIFRLTSTMFFYRLTFVCHLCALIHANLDDSSLQLNIIFFLITSIANVIAEIIDSSKVGWPQVSPGLCVTILCNRSECAIVPSNEACHGSKEMDAKKWASISWNYIERNLLTFAPLSMRLKNARNAHNVEQTIPSFFTLNVSPQTSSCW